MADDESLTRLSTIRILKTAANKHNIEINVMESYDGLETAFLIYKCFSLGYDINFIISDENMNFVNGSKSYDIIEEIFEKNKLINVPFYLITASNCYYSDFKLLDKLSGILNKPLLLDSAEHILLKHMK